MTQGVFVNGRRPASKKAIKTALAELGPDKVAVEATSIFGNEYDGPLSGAPIGQTFTFVGPDPYTKRNFYGNLKYNTKTGQWVVT